MSLPPSRADRWRRVNELFHGALALAPAERRSWMERECGGDTDLLREVSSLLASHDEAGTFLEKPAAASPLVRGLFDSATPLFSPGDVTGDFTIERVLGAGSFGTVYLAVQSSLGRRVALKVSPNLGEEGRTMAHLEHANIVRVFSEQVREKAHLRYIAMQYVPGTNLETLLRELPENASGRDFLATIDRIGSSDGIFDPAALKDRETLSGYDGVETVLWVGVRLAHALHYAHERGIVHLDVKPGNILVNPYGTPLLTDFNVSLREREFQGSGALVGGTMTYMPPEQRLLFELPRDRRQEVRLDARADVFALATVLREMLDRLGPGGRDCADVRHTLERALAPDPERRTPTAAALARCLEGCLELRGIRKQLPEPGLPTRLMARYPVPALLVFTLLPQIAGSAVNISYNSLRIVSFLSPEQQRMFEWLCVAYNAVSYPVCVGFFLWKVLPLLPYFRDPSRAGEGIRGRLLRVPHWLVLVTTLGWMPGSVIFPWILHLTSGPIPQAVFGHFFVSFTLSWLIALTYSFLLLQYLVLRVLYPDFWFGAGEVRATAARELGALRPTLRVFPYMAGFVPLVGAALVVAMGPDPAHFTTYRWLTAGLIGLGMAGLCLALRASQLLSQTLYALTGSSR